MWKKDSGPSIWMLVLSSAIHKVYVTQIWTSNKADILRFSSNKKKQRS